LSVLDSCEVPLDDGREDSLARDDLRQAAEIAVALTLDVIEEDDRTIGVQALGGERVIETNLSLDDRHRTTDVLQAHARLTECGKDHRLREAHEWHRRVSPRGAHTPHKDRRVRLGRAALLSA
jgi:hypothetical protein